MTILPAFNGLSGARLALDDTNLVLDSYYSSEADKYAIKVADDNFPQDIPYKLGDITKIDTSVLPSIDLLVGGSPCFIAGTKTIAAEGYKNIEGIVVGDEVMPHTQDFNKVIPQVFINLPKELLEEVLDGYMSGDGYIDSKESLLIRL